MPLPSLMKVGAHAPAGWWVVRKITWKILNHILMSIHGGLILRWCTAQCVGNRRRPIS